MIDINGGIDGEGEAPEADDLEPLGEFKLPILAFRGLEREVMVDGSPIPEPRSVLGFLRGMRAAIVGRPGAGIATVALDTFLRNHPHPEHHATVCARPRTRIASTDSVPGFAGSVAIV